MLPPKIPLGSPGQRRLIKCFNTLNDADQQTLLTFAEFLMQRDGSSASRDASELPEPKKLPRPEQESVVAAIRRLSDTFFMLNKDTVLHESSSLMTAHIMRGEPAGQVIDKLEVLFEAEYKRMNATDQPTE